MVWAFLAIDKRKYGVRVALPFDQTRIYIQEYDATARLLVMNSQFLFYMSGQAIRRDQSYPKRFLMSVDLLGAVLSDCFCPSAGTTLCYIELLIRQEVQVEAAVFHASGFDYVKDSRHGQRVPKAVQQDCCDQQMAGYRRVEEKVDPL